MIAFTVMDHDVITANDFAGEGFLSLNSIPGVAELNLGIENFHGLKAIDLVLMQQRDKREFERMLLPLDLTSSNLLARSPSPQQITPSSKYSRLERSINQRLTSFESRKLEYNLKCTTRGKTNNRSRGMENYT